MNRFLNFLFGSLLPVLLLVCLCGCAGSGDSESSLDLRSRVREVQLDNGMTFLLLKREGAPVFSAQLRVRVGGLEEAPGKSGLAHFFEHMAFKGTDRIGTSNFEEEKKILDQVLKLGTEINNRIKNGEKLDDLQDLIARRKALEEKQKAYIVPNEFVKIYQENGGNKLNATTTNDFTTYYISLPSSKLELWAYLESSRFQHSVLREFFTEIDVVAEERRMRYDNDPDGKLYEAYLGSAFDKSPYRVPVIGYAQDIQRYNPEDATAFYERYYIPSRMVAALVGNFDLDDAEKIVRQYFSVLPKRDDPKEEFPKEVFDGKNFPRSVTVTGEDNPRFYVGFHRPANPHPDDEVFDMIQSVMCEGKTSRLYRKLVIEEKRVATIDCFSSMPGARLDTLFTFYAQPLAGYTNLDIEKVIDEEIAKLAATGPTEKEMQIVVKNLDADFVYSLDSNNGLASQLSFFHALTGDWKYIYHLHKRIHEITAEDVKRVAKTYLIPERRVSAYLEQNKVAGGAQ